MKKHLSHLVLTLLIINALSVVGFNVKPSKGTWTGTVYIRADGSIDPPNAPIITYDNATYTLVGHITSPGDGIIIERDNVIIDGAGYIVNGTPTGSKGIYLFGRNNVTVKNMNIFNFNRGVMIECTLNAIIYRNNVTDADFGIYMDESFKINVADNNFLNSPIYLFKSINITICRNTFVGCGLVVYNSYNNIVVGNTVNGKPLVYLEGMSDMVVEDAGQVILVNCNRIAIRNLTISNTSPGIQLWETHNSIIIGNNMSENAYGIHLVFCRNNTILRNNFVNNIVAIDVVGFNNSLIENIIVRSDIGIELSTRNATILRNKVMNSNSGIHLWWSENNTIMENEMLNNNLGIKLESSAYNIIRKNYVVNNSIGLVLTASNRNIISDNTFVRNGIITAMSYNNVVVDNTVNGKPLVYLEDISDSIVEDAGQVILVNCNRITIKNSDLSYTTIGVQLWKTNETIISKNNLTYNLIGVFLIFSSNNLILENNIANHNYSGVCLYSSSNNMFYHNNFINNTKQVEVYPVCVNDWDDGYPSGGNYWDDYTGVDYYSGPSQDQPGSDGIGDTPYVIDADNRDRYPLMNPYGASPLPTYSLIIMTTAGGTTNPAPGTYCYAVGMGLNVTAIPNTGYSFAYWLFDGQKRTENPITVLMDANHTLIAHFVDDIKPEIGEPSQNPPPENVQPYQDVTVTVIVTDYGSGVKNVTLWYNLNNGTTWITLNMTELAANTYQATIPGYGNCTWITYKIVAYDNAENMAVKDNNGYNYQYHVIPEIPLTTMFIASLILTTIITIITPKTKRKHQSTNFSL